MDVNDLKNKIKQIVDKCVKLKDYHTDEKDIPVSYVCIFSHTHEEYDILIDLARELGNAIIDTKTGPVFKIEMISTIAGNLRFLKIRKPDPEKTQLGYADFNVKDYAAIKKRYLENKTFTLTIRDDYEFIGVKDPSFNVIAYFASVHMDEYFEKKVN